MIMKTNFRHLSSRFFFIALFLFSFASCKKKEEEIVRIQSVIPQDIIDNLQSRGMAINSGSKPPKLDFAIEATPYELLEPYGSDDNYYKGEVIADYRYKFYGQTEKQEITYDYYNNGADKGAGQGAFIIGAGNKFTIFSEDIGKLSGISYKTATIISGEISGNTIKNFQYAFVLKEKDGDERNVTMMPVNKSRIWIDGDFISESISNFRLSGKENVKTGSMLSAQ